MEKITLLKIGLILLLLYFFRLLWKGDKPKKDYMEELLKHTQEVKGQWDK